MPISGHTNATPAVRGISMQIMDGHRAAKKDASPRKSFEQKERQRMLLALALLLIALIAVAIRNRQFWWTSPSNEEQESMDDDSGGRPGNGNHHRATATPTASRAKPSPPRASKLPETPPVITTRTVLPPLEVEVVAGNQHHPIQTQNSSIRVDMEPQASVASSLASNSGSNAQPADVQVTRRAAEVISRPVKPDYPLLARQMKVQGAVVLQALIGKEGTIQDLQVVSGPSILSAAAREAVSQWKFKPYYEQGQQVETQARITVNFTISTY